ncbi:Uncharacterised protein [Serratia plymuthica]|nr:Uncharacterised protein [Serratia plymuthica]
MQDLAYPNTVTIDGIEYRSNRKAGSNIVMIPYSEEPNVGIGDLVYQKAGKNEIILKVIDLDFQPGGTLNVGTPHPNLLNLSVENISSSEHKTTSSSNTTYNINSLSGTQVQLGNNNSQITNITIRELVEKVAATNDPDAKSLLKGLLENSTVSSIIGAGASTLFGLLS